MTVLISTVIISIETNQIKSSLFERSSEHDSSEILINAVNQTFRWLRWLQVDIK